MPESTSWIPSTTHWLLVFHLLDEDDAPSSPCPIGSILEPYTWQMILGLDEGLCHHHIPYRWFTSIIDPLGDPWGCPCTPTHTWSTTRICLENKGPTPCPLCLESILSPWHILDFIRPSQWPNGSFLLLLCLLERIIFMLLSYLGGLVTKGCHYCTLFYYLGLN